MTVISATTTAPPTEATTQTMAPTEEPTTQTTPEPPGKVFLSCLRNKKNQTRNFALPVTRHSGRD